MLIVALCSAHCPEPLTAKIAKAAPINLLFAISAISAVKRSGVVDREPKLLALGRRFSAGLSVIFNLLAVVDVSPTQRSSTFFYQATNL
jgi:hypothetical protein